MKIIKYKKQKNNIYEVTLDDDRVIKLYDDVIIKYSLLINKVIDDDKLNEIVNYNDSLDAYYLSIKYISKKLKCEKEISRYLKNKDFSNEVILNTVSKLKKDGYLNNDVYISSFINDSFNFKSDGPVKIKNNLIELGFKEEEISKYLNKDFSLKVNRIIDKKLVSNHNLSEQMFKMKMSNYLINLGYTKDMFIDYLSNISINNDSIILKDFMSIYRKYKDKYDDKNKLIYCLKDKLYRKGYCFDEINDIISKQIN